MVKQIESRSILNKSKKRDKWFLDDYTLNPYSACSFNCLYCYIRGSKYGEHMERSLTIKTNAPELLRKALSLRAKKNQYGIIVLSSATDPYLQAEEEFELTRELLKIILEFRFPVHIITKSHLVVRDLELLKKINKTAILPPDLQNKLSGGTIVSFSFSTLSDQVAGIFEPGATPPSIRLETMKEVLKSGLHTGVTLMPLLPYISDTDEELQTMFESFKKARVNYILPAGLTLFGNGRSDSKTLVFRAISKHYPELVDSYQQLFNQSYQVQKSYQNQLQSKLDSFISQYEIGNSILSFEP